MRSRRSPAISWLGRRRRCEADIATWQQPVGLNFSRSISCPGDVWSPLSNWDPDFAKRKMIEGSLGPMIPGFSIRQGGATSTDVPRPDIYKAYGVKKLGETLGVAIGVLIFVTQPYGSSAQPNG